MSNEKEEKRKATLSALSLIAWHALLSNSVAWENTPTPKGLATGAIQHAKKMQEEMEKEGIDLPNL